MVRFISYSPERALTQKMKGFGAKEENKLSILLHYV